MEPEPHEPESCVLPLYYTPDTYTNLFLSLVSKTRLIILFIPPNAAF